MFSQFDNAGTSAANFLKIGVGGRGTALSGAFVAVVDDPSALYWNVAGISHFQQNEIMFSHNDWIADINHSFLAAGFPLKDIGTIGISVSHLSMGEMKVTTWEETDGTGGTFSAYDIAVGIAYAKKLTDQISFGIQPKYVSEVISQSNASAFAIDAGMQYNTEFQGIKLGAALTNFGTKMRLQGRDTRITIDPFPIAGSNPNDVVANTETQEWLLPMTFHFGIAIDALRNDNNTLVLNLDYQDERDFMPVPFLGAEYSFRETVFLRFGANGFFFDKIMDNKLDEKYVQKAGMSAGVGFHWEIPETKIVAKIDYSYSDLNILQSSQRITVGFSF